MVLDILLGILGLIIVGLSIHRRFIGSLLLLAGAYLSLLLALVSYETVAYRLQAIGEGALWFEALMFILIYLVSFFVFFIISKVTFEDTSMPKIKFLDPLLGALVGVVIAAATMVVVYRGLGYILSSQLAAERSPVLFQLYYTSDLGGWLYRIYRWLSPLYVFFFPRGFPSVWTSNYQ